MTSDKAYTNEQRLNALIGAQTDWADFGSLSAGWSKTGGFVCRYRKDLAGNVHVQMQDINIGTTTNGTTILTSGNGLPTGFRIGTFAYMPVRVDVEGSQQAAFYVGNDGHMECYGIDVTATRADCYFTFYAEN